jgi:hypothetical protein
MPPWTNSNTFAKVRAAVSDPVFRSKNSGRELRAPIDRSCVMSSLAASRRCRSVQVPHSC